MRSPKRVTSLIKSQMMENVKQENRRWRRNQRSKLNMKSMKRCKVWFVWLAQLCLPKSTKSLANLDFS